MADINRRSNFVFSSDQNHLYSQTSHNQDYLGKGVNKNGAEASSKMQQLRKTNFTLGFEKGNYATTAGENQVSDQGANSKNQKKPKMQKHSIVYGFDRQSYDTTNLQAHDLNHYEKDNKLLKQRAADLRKNNFHFWDQNDDKGLNSGHAQSPAQHVGAAIGGQQSKTISQQFRRANFSLGNDTGEYRSSTQDQLAKSGNPVAQKAARQSNPEMLKQMKDNLRSSHFHMGNAQGAPVTTASENYKQYQISGFSSNRNQELAKKMREPNFQLGNAKPDNVSSYNLASRNVPKYYKKPSQDDVLAKQTNIKTYDQGEGPMNSEAKSKFQNFSNRHYSQNRQENAAMVNKLKRNHFDLSTGRKTDFQTVSKQQFGTKDVEFVKAKANMQKTNFIMGDSKSAYGKKDAGAAKTGSFQRMVGTAHSAKQQNFSLGTQGGDFKTMNQGNYKWIQPQPE